VKTVSQTKFSLFFSDGTRLTYGNCLVACIASVLGEPIEEVPNLYTFYGLDDKENTETENHLWFKVINLWLEKKYKKTLVKHSLEEETHEQFVIMRGLSMRGKPHTCIFENREGKLVPYFDPHPTKEYLSKQHYYYTIESIFKSSL
jgi:hypothetical protein